MKNFLGYMLVIMLMMVSFSSCGKTEDTMFSNEELRQMAGIYYAVQHEGIIPSEIIVEDVDENSELVRIHLYENLEDHSVTRDWYEVNRYTGIGTNVNFEEIDLTEVLEGIR